MHAYWSKLLNWCHSELEDELDDVDSLDFTTKSIHVWSLNFDKSSRIDLTRKHMDWSPRSSATTPITRGQMSTQNCGRNSTKPISKLDACFLRSKSDFKAPAADVAAELQVAFDALDIQDQQILTYESMTEETRLLKGLKQIKAMEEWERGI